MVSTKSLKLALFCLTALTIGCGTKQKATDGAKPAADMGSQTCTYGTDPKQIKLEWTAYKFTNKTPVKGSFTSTTFSGPESAATVKDLFKGLSAEIDGKTPDSKDPVRNGNVANSFFAKLANDGKITAKTSLVQGDDQKGTIDIAIDMNGVNKVLTFDYTVADGVVTAKSHLDFPAFRLEEALDSLHKTCEAMHTGPDGESKTWGEADLTLTGPLKKDCK